MTRYSGCKKTTLTTGNVPKIQTSRINFKKSKTMPKYVIEGEIPEVGNFISEQLKGISQTSCGVLSTLARI